MNSPPNPTPAEIEREKIVVWLRDQKLKGMAVAEAEPARSHRERDHVVGALAIGNAADLIEHGAHLSNGGPGLGMVRGMGGNWE